MFIAGSITEVYTQGVVQPANLWIGSPLYRDVHWLPTTTAPCVISVKSLFHDFTTFWDRVPASAARIAQLRIQMLILSQRLAEAALS